MSLIGLLVLLIILCLVFWCVRTLSAAFGLPQPIQAVIMVVLVIIAVLYLLQALGLLSGGPVLRLS